MRSGVVGIIAFLVVSCQSISGDGAVEVRLHNLSTTAFDSVTVQFPRDTHRYGPLGAGELSAFATVKEAYGYARVEAWTGGEAYVIQPIDYVGERRLPAGRHTYGLTFDGDPPRLGIVMANAYGVQHDIMFLTAAQPARESMQALFEGRVVVDPAGCIRLDSPDPATVIWPHGFRLAVQRGQLLVRDGTGREIGRIGGAFRFGGGEVPTLSASILAGHAAVAARCPGRYWIVGETG